MQLPDDSPAEPAIGSPIPIPAPGPGPENELSEAALDAVVGGLSAAAGLARAGAFGWIHRLPTD